MRCLLLTASLFYLAIAQALAFTVDTPLAQDEQEALAQEIFRQVRCVVCEGQSVADSSAEIASDIRHEIRKQVTQIKSNEEILSYLTGRYGEAIRMRPLVVENKGLWLAPLGFLLAAAGIAFVCFRRR